jgi:voltage-gated potassium channel
MTSFEDLDRAQQRRLALRSAVRILGSTVVLVVLYALLPAASNSSAKTLIELIIGLAVFLAVLAWQVISILDAEYPEVRAVETLALAVPLLIIVFAFTYLSLSHVHASNFSEPLDHVGAVYFTVTVISTVGFGDIVARTDGARIIVCVQILLDLGLLVGIARTVVFAARVGVRRREESSAAGQSPPSGEAASPRGT